jgi:hypothetical protein
MVNMSLKQLEKLEANPAYKMSEKQKAQLEALRGRRFKNNPDFIKHDSNLNREIIKENK